jgi:hypothetical protein
VDCGTACLKKTATAIEIDAIASDIAAIPKVKETFERF